MAKDYFQDILPRDEGTRQVPVTKTGAARDMDIRPQTVIDESDDDLPPDDIEMEPMPERSIRNISAPQRRVRDDMLQDAPRYSPPMPRSPRRFNRAWMWGIAVVAVLAVGVLLLIALRGTSVTVEPRSHTIVFDETSRFIAYPDSSAASGTLSYTTQVLELDDSEPVESSGTVHAEDKASGSVTVINDFSTTPFRLIKNTRFESPEGLIFRAPADIVIPGKQGSTPGQISVTLVADQPGEAYNISASRLTVPGLKGGAEYTKIYAQSSAFTGGFKGERPGISDAALAGATALVRDRLEKKVRSSVAALSVDGITAFSELAQITYQDMPTTSESGGGARIHQKAVVTVPLFPSPALAQAVARTVSADAENNPIRLEGIKDFGGLLVSASSTLGTDPLQFGLTGQAILIWEVDAEALAQALAGRDQSAFQTIVTGFPGIQSATARIEPFWSSSFPSEAGRIRVKITDPKTQN